MAIYKEKEYFWQMFQGRTYHGISYKCSQKISLGNFLLMLRVCGLELRVNLTNIEKLQYISGSRCNSPTILKWIESYKFLKSFLLIILFFLILFFVFFVLINRKQRRA